MVMICWAIILDSSECLLSWCIGNSSRDKLSVETYRSPAEAGLVIYTFQSSPALRIAICVIIMAAAPNSLCPRGRSTPRRR